MANELGAKHWLGMEPQITPGVAEDEVTNFLSTTGVTANDNPNHIERKTHQGTGRFLPDRKGTIKPDGKATIELMASQPHPLLYALGAIETTEPSPGIFLHTITQADDPVNLTIEANRVYDFCKQRDAKIDKFKIHGQGGEQAFVDLEWLALGHENDATLLSDPQPEDFLDDLLTMLAGAITLDGDPNNDITQIEIDYDGQLEAPQVIEDAEGSPNRIRRKSIPTIKAKLKFLDLVKAEQAKRTSAGPFDLVLYVQGDLISTIYYNFLRVTLTDCQYVGGLDSEVGEDVVTADADLKATGITIEAQNEIEDINGPGLS